MARDNFDWTPGRIAEAQALREQGLSGREIGERFGVSRSAVLGMFHRVAQAALVIPESPK